MKLQKYKVSICIIFVLTSLNCHWWKYVSERVSKSKKNIKGGRTLLAFLVRYMMDSVSSERDSR